MSDVDKLRHAVEDVGYGFEERLQSAATVDTEAVLDRLGLEEANSPDETVSVLCAFNLLLKSTLYRRHREEFESLDPLEDPKEIVSDFRGAASQTGDDGLDPWKLDELAMHLDTEAFERLLDSRDELVDAADPTRLIGELFERLVVVDSEELLWEPYHEFVRGVYTDTSRRPLPGRLSNDPAGD